VRNNHFFFLAALLLTASVVFFVAPEFFSAGFSLENSENSGKRTESSGKSAVIYPPYDKLVYDSKMLELANNLPQLPTPQETPGVGTPTSENVGAKPSLWPAPAAYPNPGAILPFKRIIAFYGNLYSKKMGVLGEYPEDEMLTKLAEEMVRWQAADPTTPVVPALHYIAVVAQKDPGQDGKYRARMPGTEIEKVLAMAEKVGALVFLDLQVGFSRLEAELPPLRKYLSLPHVHLGVDPEFSMKGTIPPGKVVGTYDAADINFAAGYLAGLVYEQNLPPKILVVHRYTERMVTNSKLIVPLPEVQIVMHMDGWGPKAKKETTYREFIYKEPVQFTGFKLFYKNDLWEPGTTLMTPEEILRLRPKPSYIQYQ
jgi:hypothetical protein